MAWLRPSASTRMTPAAAPGQAGRGTVRRVSLRRQTHMHVTIAWWGSHPWKGAVHARLPDDTSPPCWDVCWAPPGPDTAEAEEEEGAEVANAVLELVACREWRKVGTGGTGDGMLMLNQLGAIRTADAGPAMHCEVRWGRDRWETCGKQRWRH